MCCWKPLFFFNIEVSVVVNVATTVNTSSNMWKPFKTTVSNSSSERNDQVNNDTNKNARKSMKLSVKSNCDKLWRRHAHKPKDQYYVQLKNPPKLRHRHVYCVECHSKKNYRTSQKKNKIFNFGSLVLAGNVFMLLILSLCCGVNCSLNKSRAHGVYSKTVAANVHQEFITTEYSNSYLPQAYTNSSLDSVMKECQRRCAAETNLYNDEFGITCYGGNITEKCYQYRCNKGCGQWWQALQEFEPCQEACSTSSFYPYDIPCIAACELGQHLYWNMQRLSLAKIVHIVKPQWSLEPMQQNNFHHGQQELLEDTHRSSEGFLTNFLRLRWQISLPDNYQASRPFNIQFAIVSHPSDIGSEAVGTNCTTEETVWHNIADYNCVEHFDCEILETLMAFTNYRFRFELPFGEDVLDVLHSPESSVYTTSSLGVPKSSPSIESVFAMDDSHVVIFWQLGQFVNGPLQAFKLVLHQNMNNYTAVQVLSPSLRQYIFADLMPQTNYTLHIAMVNQEGAGPNATISIVTKNVINSFDTVELLQSALLVSQHDIKLQTLQRPSEIEELHRSESGISDVDLNSVNHMLYVLDNEGKVFTFPVNNRTDISQIFLNVKETDFTPLKLSVDWLNQRIFLAGKFNSNAWAIVSCDVEGNSWQEATTNLTEAVEQIVVDPNNGWVFWSTRNSLNRLDLTTNSMNSIVHSAASKEIGYFINDFQRTLLIIHNRTDGEIYESSYDGSHYRRLQRISDHGDKYVQSFMYHNGMLMSINGTHLRYRNYQTKEYDNWEITGMDECWRFWTKHNMLGWIHLQKQEQPHIHLERTPRHLQALVTSQAASISWQAPAISRYQTPSAWKAWEYELEILDVASNSAFNIRNIKTNYFIVDKLQANNLYSIRVRAVDPSVAGEGALNISGVPGTIPLPININGDIVDAGWSEELLTRTWPIGEHKLWWVGDSCDDLNASSALYETNEIGMQAKRIAVLRHSVQNFVQLNGTLYYVSRGRREEAFGDLRCVNVMNPEADCTFSARNAVSIAYDWRAGKVYWTDKLKNCVVRSNLMSDCKRNSFFSLNESQEANLIGENELLPIFGARQIEIDAENGFLYYSTGKRLLRRTLNGIRQPEEVEYFHVNGLSGRICAFTVAYKQHQLFWIVRQHEGHVHLFKMILSKLQEGQQQLIVKKLDSDVQFGSLTYLSAIDCLVWLENKSNRAFFLRADNLRDMAKIVVPHLKRITAVHLKAEQVMFRDFSVQPDAVNSLSIAIESGGYWDDFNVRWNPTVMENITVFYKVLLQYNDGLRSRIHALEVRDPIIRIREFHQPSLLFNLSVTPHTYWQAGITTEVQMRTPEAAPTRPKRLRIFVESIEQPLQRVPNISALIRWDPPENISLSTAMAYKIFCWFNNELFAEHVHNYSDAVRPLEARLSNLRVGETYTFQVQAFAAGRMNGGEKTAYHALHVNPNVQTTPHLLYATSEYIAELDMDMQSHKILVHTNSEVEHFAVIRGENHLLWVNDNVELMSFVAGKTPVKLVRMRGEVVALTVNWITRIVYWAETIVSGEATVAIYKIDLCQFEGRVMLGTKLFTAQPGRRISNMIVLPFAQALLWLEHEAGKPKAILVGRDLNDFSHIDLKMENLLHMFEGSSTSELDTVNLIDKNNKVCLFDFRRHICTSSQDYLNDIAEELRDVQRDVAYVYTLHNETIRVFNQHRLTLEYMFDVFKIRKIRSYNQQLYPRRECLLYSPDVQMRPTLLVEHERYFVLRLPSLNTESDCLLPLPGVKYSLIIWDAQNQTRTVTSFRNEVNVTELEPYSNYTLQLRATVFHAYKLQLPVLQSKRFVVRTAIGIPVLPTSFLAVPLSPTEIHVNWTVPEKQNCDKTFYQLHWQGDDSTIGANKTLQDTEYTISNLESGRIYNISIKVLCSIKKYNVSSGIVVQTYASPNEVQLVDRTANNLTLSWQRSSNLDHAILIFQSLNADIREINLEIEETERANTLILIPNLAAKTTYKFYLKLFYTNVRRPYYWPELLNDRFVFETLGDRPNCPGRPDIEMITDDILKVSWEPARDNGATIVEYNLEALQSHVSKRLRRNTGNSHFITANETNSKDQYNLFNQLPWVEEPEPLEDKWLISCITAELSCIVRDVHAMRLLMFRVRARNVPYGWGPYSQESLRFLEPYVTSEKRESLIFAIIGPGCIVFSCVVMLMVVRLVHNRRAQCKKLSPKSRPSIWSNLSTVQQQHLMMERQRAFSVTSNSAIYGLGPLSDADIALLPHINWGQITLLKFLGSGAFGEVYEGIIKHNDDKVENVAIKSLRKGSSEFTELLQEAQLMSNFQHENIVKLIGICFDTDCISIIMEHMEGGDLLTYMRESRPNANLSNGSLHLLDLITMCIDVATGCSYLEDMHFVHRDLACRNCLVSSREPIKRTVKIGDFGLARDIYKHDYYRKEGEGMLPVRWMSPESLMDGIFTTQSDVWSYAVLCWEILTMGQQPYPTRNNFEVLSYVKVGGRLEQPDNCPDKLFQLWLECWNEVPELRPTFHRCRDVLVTLKTDIRRANISIEFHGDQCRQYENQTDCLPTSLSKTMEQHEDISSIKHYNKEFVNPVKRTDVKVHFEVSNNGDEFDNSELRKYQKPLKKPNRYIDEGVSRF